MTAVKKLRISINYNHSKLPIFRYKTFLLRKKKEQKSDIPEPYANIMIFKNINLGIIEKYSSYHEINMNIEKDKKRVFILCLFIN